jgi:hypothetical protein
MFTPGAARSTNGDVVVKSVAWSFSSVAPTVKT